jgi:hypothetical protein
MTSKAYPARRSTTTESPGTDLLRLDLGGQRAGALHEGLLAELVGDDDAGRVDDLDDGGEVTGVGGAAHLDDLGTLPQAHQGAGGEVDAVDAGADHQAHPAAGGVHLGGEGVRAGLQEGAVGAGRLRQGVQPAVELVELVAAGLEELGELGVAGAEGPVGQLELAVGLGTGVHGRGGAAGATGVAAVAGVCCGVVSRAVGHDHSLQGR